MRGKSFLLLVILTMFWGLNFPLLKIGLLYESSLYIMFFRILVAVLFMFIVFHKKIKFPKSIRANIFLFIFGLFNMILFFGFWSIGEGTESASLSSIIIYTYPIIVIILARVFLSDKLNKYKTASLILGFAGMVIIFSNQLLVKFNIGLVYLLIAAISFSSGAVFMKKYLININPITINFVQSLYSLPVMFLWAFFTEKINFSGFNIYFISIVLYMGILGTAVAYSIYIDLYQHLNVSSIASYFFLVPAFSVVFTLIILHEINSYYTYIGFIIIGTGIFLTSKTPKNKKNVNNNPLPK